MMERVMEMDKEFKVFIDNLCRSGLGKEVYLVGSRARGDNKPYSDYDIVVVIDNNQDHIDVAEKIQLLKKSKLPIDVIVIKENDVEDSIYNEMMKYRKSLCKHHSAIQR